MRLAAKIAAETGREFSDLTTHREIQLYGLRPEERPEILQQLEAAGIHSQGPGESLQAARCPLAEMDSAGAFDAGVHEQAPLDRDLTGQEHPELFTMAVPILAGRIGTDQMRKVADLAERHADGALRLTPRQNILLLNVPKERVAQILEGLEIVQLGVQASAAARAVVLCPSGESGGSEGPGTASLAREMVEHLERRVPMDRLFTIHMSGWDGGCAQPPIGEIALQGVRAEVDGRVLEAFDLWVCGRLRARQVPAGQLRFKIEQLLIGYKRNRNPEEPLGDFFARVDEAAFSQLLSEPALETKKAG